MTTPCEKLLAEVEARLEKADGRYGTMYENQWPPNTELHRHSRTDLETLAKMVRCAREALVHVAATTDYKGFAPRAGIAADALAELNRLAEKKG